MRKMNNQIAVYLGGPMAGCSLEEMTDWRNQLKKDYPDIKWLDPCERSYVPQQWRELVEADMKDIDNADLVLCYMWKPGIGSSMELTYARAQKTPTIVVVPDFKYVSPWVRYYADYLVENFDHAMKIINAEWVQL
jgi:nucleoside 2-deoxyribosyltransferase